WRNCCAIMGVDFEPKCTINTWASAAVPQGNRWMRVVCAMPSLLPTLSLVRIRVCYTVPDTAPHPVIKPSPRGRGDRTHLLYVRTAPCRHIQVSALRAST